MDSLSVFLQTLIATLLSVLTQLLPVLASAAVLYIAPKVKAWLDARQAELRAGLTEQQYLLLNSFVEQAIRAAHQSGLIGQIENTGAAKKRYAIDFVEGLLKQFNIDFDLDVVANMIESEVNRVLVEVWTTNNDLSNVKPAQPALKDTRPVEPPSVG